MSRPQPCRCAAYPFPHRKDGGQCQHSEHSQTPELTTEHWSTKAMHEAGHKNGDFL